MTVTCPACARPVSVETLVRCQDCTRTGCVCGFVSFGYGKMRCAACVEKRARAKPFAKIGKKEYLKT